MIPGGDIKVSDLGLLAFAVYSKSPLSVKYLLEKFSTNYSLRSLYQPGTYSSWTGGISRFSSPILPLLVRTRDLEILTQISKHPSFIIPTIDELTDFVKLCISEKWPQGAKALLTSATAHSKYQLSISHKFFL
jgi:hypothetical protein